MITPTQQIVCSIVSRQLIADLSPTSRQRVADQSQPISNQLAINRPPVADRSPIFRDSCRRPVADWSATEKMRFWSHSGCIGCSCFLVARQSPTGCSACVTGALFRQTFMMWSLRLVISLTTPLFAQTCIMANNKVLEFWIVVSLHYWHFVLGIYGDVPHEKCIITACVKVTMRKPSYLRIHKTWVIDQWIPWNNF